MSIRADRLISWTITLLPTLNPPLLRMPAFFSVHQSTTYDSCTAFSCESPCSPKSPPTFAIPKRQIDYGIVRALACGVIWKATELLLRLACLYLGALASFRIYFLNPLQSWKSPPYLCSPLQQEAINFSNRAKTILNFFRPTVAKPVKFVTFALPNRLGHCFDNNIGLKINPHCYFKWKWHTFFEWRKQTK